MTLQNYRCFKCGCENKEILLDCFMCKTQKKMTIIAQIENLPLYQCKDCTFVGFPVHFEQSQEKLRLLKLLELKKRNDVSFGNSNEVESRLKALMDLKNKSNIKNNDIVDNLTNNLTNLSIAEPKTKTHKEWASYFQHTCKIPEAYFLKVSKTMNLLLNCELILFIDEKSTKHLTKVCPRLKGKFTEKSESNEVKGACKECFECFRVFNVTKKDGEKLTITYE